MSLQNSTREELQMILVQLDQALYNHQQWNNSLIRALICRLPISDNDILLEAYKECLFGQWYYYDAPKKLYDYEGFVSIGQAHEQVHQQAGFLLNQSRSNNPITEQDYDLFANTLERLHLEMSTLKNDLENLLYNRDPLTMAINRDKMLPILREQQELVRRNTQSCCIAMMDVDFFKIINDDYGHIIGDQILSNLSHFLIEHLRPYDRLFRYGGGKFLICMQHINLTEAYKKIEFLRQGIASKDFDIGRKQSIRVTVSFGLNLLDSNVPVEESIVSVEKALLAAKSAGKNFTETWKTP
jgi:diguanylate cyclase